MNNNLKKSINEKRLYIKWLSTFYLMFSGIPYIVNMWWQEINPQVLIQTNVILQPIVILISFLNAIYFITDACSRGKDFYNSSNNFSSNCSEQRVALHNMTFVQECKQKAINKRCYGGSALYNRQWEFRGFCLACCFSTDCMFKRGVNAATGSIMQFIGFLLLV